jgi:hypothetical protein
MPDVVPVLKATEATTMNTKKTSGCRTDAGVYRAAGRRTFKARHEALLREYGLA